MSKASSLFSKKRIVPAALVVAVAVLAWWGWQRWSDHGPGEGFASGNGRIEATEIDVATKLPGRVEEILVREGDFVQAGQTLGTVGQTGRATGAHLHLELWQQGADCDPAALLENAP